MDKHLLLSSLDVCQLMADIDGTEPMDLAEFQEDIEYQFEDIRENIFLETVFGNLSRMAASDWIAEV